MINIKAIEKRVKKIKPKVDLVSVVEFILEKDGKYYDKNNQICDLDGYKSDNGLVYVLMADQKNNEV